MTTPSPETQPFQAEIRKLLDILVHSLYTDREIFLRELISNASDALHRIQFEMLTNSDVRDPEAELQIRIHGDAETGTLTIEDSGIGMTRQELIEHLGTIARSGAESFVKSLEAGQKGEQIGQFGVGFYSVFMVAEEVRVTSQSYRPDAEAWAWVSRGEDSFRLEPAEKVGRGTKIEIKLKEDDKEFAETFRLREIINRHSDFVSFPIYIGEDVVNRQTAIWRQSASAVSDEAANEFYRQLTFDYAGEPLLRLQVNADVPVQIRALMFIPAKLERATGFRQDFGLKLYSHKIRIQDHNKDLLPNYLRFVEGVVDSDDLALNVSRETVQASPVMRLIKDVLSSRVLNAIKEMAEGDAEKYAQFWREFSPFIKEGIATALADKDKLLPLLRFYTSHSHGNLTSLGDYILRISSAQKQIYYIVGEDLRSVERSPHLDYFRRENIEVLYLVDPLDGILPSALGEYEGYTLQNIDDAGLELPKSEKQGEGREEDAVTDADLAPLIERLKARLGDKVVDVRSSDRLVDSPARLVSPEGSFGSEMARVRRLFEEDFELPKKILEINPRHPLISNLSAMLVADEKEAVVDAVVEQIYENGLLLEGIHPNPADMVERLQVLMAAATQSA